MTTGQTDRQMDGYTGTQISQPPRLLLHRMLTATAGCPSLGPKAPDQRESHRQSVHGKWCSRTRHLLVHPTAAPPHHLSATEAAPTSRGLIFHSFLNPHSQPVLALSELGTPQSSTLPTPVAQGSVLASALSPSETLSSLSLRLRLVKRAH